MRIDMQHAAYSVDASPTEVTEDVLRERAIRLVKYGLAIVFGLPIGLIIGFIIALMTGTATIC